MNTMKHAFKTLRDRRLQCDHLYKHTPHMRNKWICIRCGTVLKHQHAPNRVIRRVWETLNIEP